MARPRPVRLLLALAVACALLASAVPIARADPPAGAWLDDPAPVNWNTPGAAVPRPTQPTDAGPIPDMCQGSLRTPETAEDQQVADAGWTLWGSYQSGWGVRVVNGTVAMDGQCRPFGWQAFVFVDGAFAGTLMPGPWAPRSDGTLWDAYLNAADRIDARFMRYAQPFPLCCPTGEAFVTFDIVRGPNGPVVRPGAPHNQPIAGS